MPPRHVYWTIIAGGQPTAFRAAEREELLPTLKQLQSRHPDAVMMWFARGKLWPTKEAAEFTLRQEHRGGSGGERRGKDWRPGGEHKDPRDRFKVPRDVKRARFAERARRDRTDGEPTPDRREGGEDRPIGTRPTAPRGDRPQGDRPFRPKGDRPQGDRPFRPRQDRAPGDRPFRPKGERPQGERPFRPRGEGGFKPRGGKPGDDQPKGPGRPPRGPGGGGGFKPRGRPGPPKPRSGGGGGRGSR